VRPDLSVLYSFVVMQQKNGRKPVVRAIGGILWVEVTGEHKK
jgi:hypothetical protein